MTVIVAFGDSNTWGYDPASARGFRADVRWTGVMQRELGPAIAVIEEGLNGRTTVFDDPIEPDRRGADYLPPCLRSHAPLDLLIIALGCNDLKPRFSALAGRHRQRRRAPDPDRARRAVGPGGAPPAILLVAPPPIAQADRFRRDVRRARRRSRPARARAIAKSPSGRDRLRRRRPVHRLLDRSTASISRPISTRSSACAWPRPRAWSVDPHRRQTGAQRRGAP